VPLVRGPSPPGPPTRTAENARTASSPSPSAIVAGPVARCPVPGAVEVKQAYPGRQQPARHDLCHALNELIAQARVSVAFAAPCVRVRARPVTV